MFDALEAASGALSRGRLPDTQTVFVGALPSVGPDLLPDCAGHPGATADCGHGDGGAGGVDPEERGEFRALSAALH